MKILLITKEIINDRKSLQSTLDLRISTNFFKILFLSLKKYMKKVIPNSIENKAPDSRFVYYFAWLLVGFNFFRSLEHIFNEDGGAESIAGIPLSTYSTEAAANIIAIFAQWGFFSVSFILFFATNNYKNERTHTSYVDYCCFGEYFKRRSWALQIFNFRRCTSWGSITDSWTCYLSCIFLFQLKIID